MFAYRAALFLMQRLKAVIAVVVTSAGAIAYALGLPAWVALIAVAVLTPPGVHQIPNTPQPAPAAPISPSTLKVG